MQDSSEHKLYIRFIGYLNADFQFHCNYLILSNTSFQSNERHMFERVLNWFSSIQFLETTYARHVGLLRGCFCVFDVMNTVTLSSQFVGRNTPAIYSRIFHSRIFSAPAPWWYQCNCWSVNSKDRVYKGPWNEQWSHWEGALWWQVGLFIKRSGRCWTECWRVPEPPPPRRGSHMRGIGPGRVGLPDADAGRQWSSDSSQSTPEVML